MTTFEQILSQLLVKTDLSSAIDTYDIKKFLEILSKQKTEHLIYCTLDEILEEDPEWLDKALLNDFNDIDSSQIHYENYYEFSIDNDYFSEKIQLLNYIAIESDIRWFKEWTTGFSNYGIKIKVKDSFIKDDEGNDKIDDVHLLIPDPFHSKDYRYRLSYHLEYRWLSKGFNNLDQHKQIVLIKLFSKEINNFYKALINAVKDSFEE